MATKTYYAKLDCFYNPLNSEHFAGEAFKSFCDFMTYISGSNRATLITWNSGSSALPGSFESRTYWDGALPFGRGAHAVWRINSGSNRGWDWYLYAQVVSGSGAVANEAFNVPIVNCGSANMYNFSLGRGAIIQSAVCFSGSDSFNPWNGTISQGNSTAGNPRWASGSDSRTMYVLPRSNDRGGSHFTSRNNSYYLFPYNTTDGVPARNHMVFDGDALCILEQRFGPDRYYMTYIGPFELRGSLSGSGIGGGQQGFMMHQEVSPTGESKNLPQFGTSYTFGGTLGTSTDRGGGVAVPIGVAVSGSLTGVLQAGSASPFFNIASQPNYYTENYDEFPIMVGINETPTFAFLGQMNYGLIRTVNGSLSQDANADLSRAIFGGGTGVVGNFMASLAWSGTLGPGVANSRTGSQFTWTKDYG